MAKHQLKNSWIATTALLTSALVGCEGVAERSKQVPRKVVASALKTQEPRSQEANSPEVTYTSAPEAATDLADLQGDVEMHIGPTDLVNIDPNRVRKNAYGVIAESASALARKIDKALQNPELQDTDHLRNDYRAAMQIYEQMETLAKKNPAVKPRPSTQTKDQSFAELPLVVVEM